MKRVMSSRMDENFYTIPKHVPSVDVAVDNTVTISMVDMLKDICNKLELDFKDVGWDIVTTREFNRFKNDIVKFVTEYIKSHT